MPQLPAPRLPAADLRLILERTVDLWTEIRGQRIFLTGGTGFFGCWLLESFAFINRVLNLNAQAIVLAPGPSAFAAKCPHLANEESITFLPGDVRSFPYPDGDFAYVIHAATNASAKLVAEDPLEMYTTMVHGIERVLEFSARHNTRKLLFPSSGAVYGKQPPHLTHVPEDYLAAPDPIDPANIYAEGKRMSEQLCAIYARQANIEIKIARCFAFVGPHLPLDAHFAIGNFIRDAINGQPIAIAGDGTPLRSYLYAADLAIWLWTILFRAPSMLPLNVGSEDAVSIAALARTITTTLNPALEIKIAKQPIPGAPPIQYVPSTQRAQQLLGLGQSIPLDEAIRRTAAWHTGSATL